ncbi:hypothetical protein GBA52_027795 [Prunus armeniaca]|nr:hypothetical protein GBA52_027795 [Prunus armeniaca]
MLGLEPKTLPKGINTSNHYTNGFFTSWPKLGCQILKIRNANFVFELWFHLSYVLQLVEACPWIQGINFDLPHVVSLAQECDRIENVGGDMFDCVPKADAVIIKGVLHDWGDDECIRILKKCREAIPEDKGKVIIIEAVIDEKDEKGDIKLTNVRLMLDMVMMAHTNTGKERTLKEWGYVLGEAGFSRHTITPIHAVPSVIQAFP